MKIIHLLAAAAATAAVAVPAAAQAPYPYSYPQQAHPQPAPGQPGYGYYPQQGYGSQQNMMGQVINQLLGNRYNVTDRTAVQQCASAAMLQAQRQYPARYSGYDRRDGYNRPYADNRYNNGYAQMRVTAITEVQRRSNRGLRVQGLIDSGAYATPYARQGYGHPGQGYANPRYAQTGDLSFRCNVDYRGAVSGVRVNRYTAAYRR